MELPVRKHVRLKEYDYSRNGGYFVTVCTKDRRKILSDVVGRGLAPAEIRLTDCGQLVETELFALSVRYGSVRVEKYVIMPNHVHVLLMFGSGTAGASPRPTLMQVIGTFKSLSTRRWNETAGTGGEKLWQSGYHEHIIRDDNDFLLHWQYIDQNPARWGEDESYAENAGGAP